MTWIYDDELIDKVSLAKLFVIVNVGGLAVLWLVKAGDC